jgi:hypothetical protein
VNTAADRGRGLAKHAPKHAPRVPFALLVVTLIGGGLGLLLLLNTASAANEVRRHDLAAKDASVAAQLQELQNEVAASAAPGNLAQAAAELGMVPAGNPAFLVVGADGSVKIVGSPKAVSGAADGIPAKPKPKTSTSAKTSSARTSSARISTPKTSPNTSSRTSTGAGHGRSTGRNSSPASPTPTPTPTPTLILPGGNR